MMIGWGLLLLAIITEVAGTISMKLSEGFKHPAPSIAVFVFYGLSIAFMVYAVERINISIVYAVWSGLGTLIITIVGVYAFEESMSAFKLISIVLVIVGVIGLNLSDGGAH